MLQLIHYTVTDFLYTCPDTVVVISFGTICRNVMVLTSSVARGKSIWKSRRSLLTAKIDQVGEVDLNRNTREKIAFLQAVFEIVD